MQLHFDPKKVTAAIVTCGGLCPGLNSVIRELVLILNLYGVEKIYGIPYGYKGMLKTTEWRLLTIADVENCHQAGGTVLGSDRGNPEVPEMVDALVEMGVCQLYIIGGDGTHRGATAIGREMTTRGWECAVCGVPKTIDNDIPIIDQTFGFNTACTEAVRAIQSAYCEATCNANCIGLVKLMGRHSGFIALHACLAARNVDLCLIPEMAVDITSVLDYVEEVKSGNGREAKSRVPDSVRIITF